MSTSIEIPSSISHRLRGLNNLVGNTPLLAIEYQFRGRTRVLYAKSEQLNMTGSIKDRMALHILRTAYQNGSIRPGDTIVEATSGNTGISFAAIGRALGHPVTIFMPEWMSRERKDLIRSLGAQILAACFIIDLPDLGGSRRLEALEVPVRTLVAFQGH